MSDPISPFGPGVYTHSAITSTVMNSATPMPLSGLPGSHQYHSVTGKGNGFSIVLNGTRGFVRQVYIEADKRPWYCKITPADEVVVLDGLPEEGSPGELYFKGKEGVCDFYEVDIEAPITPKKRILEV